MFPLQKEAKFFLIASNKKVCHVLTQSIEVISFYKPSEEQKQKTEQNGKQSGASTLFHKACRYNLEDER